jgi:hypothetical protein
MTTVQVVLLGWAVMYSANPPNWAFAAWSITSVLFIALEAILDIHLAGRKP